MNNHKYEAFLRISLMLAVAAAVAVLAIVHFELRPQIRQLTNDRDHFKILSDQQLERAMKADTNARELAEQLARTQKQNEAALLENQRLIDRGTRLLVDLEETRAQLHTGKQELARWQATGVTPEQVGFLAGENKTLTAKVSRLEKEKAKIREDYAHLKRTLEPPIDDNIIPELPPMRGSVLVVDPKWNFVVLDMGEGTGLKKNGVLMVSRDGKLVGKVKVRRVEPERSIADILPGWIGNEVREGDLVMN